MCNDAVTIDRYDYAMEISLALPEAVTEPVPLRRLAQATLRRLAESTSAKDTMYTHAVFDTETDHYLLIAEGWQGYRRVYRTLEHISFRDGMLHIYEDGTVEGIADRLRAEGVPRERIVCEWSQVPVNAR